MQKTLFKFLSRLSLLTRDHFNNKTTFNEVKQQNNLNNEIFPTPTTNCKGQQSCLYTMECNGIDNQEGSKERNKLFA